MPSKKHGAHCADLIRRFDQLSDDAVVPTQVAAALHNVAPRTVLRRYPLVQLTPNRLGVRVGTIRKMSRGEKI
jgi:hypothetical protein